MIEIEFDNVSLPYAFKSIDCGEQSISIDDFDFCNNAASMQDFWQDYDHMFNRVNGSKFGGLRGIAWRSMSRRSVYGVDDFVNKNDA